MRISNLERVYLFRILLRILAVICLIAIGSPIIGLAQIDVPRRTTAITYPLDRSISLQFQGTTRFPRMKGEAKVKRTSRNGTEVEVSVSKMPRPFELGPGYATYVVWAISPDGQVDNLGEIKRNGPFEFDSKVSLKTPLQTFALIITAEPHFMVRRPSQAIMLENIKPQKVIPTVSAPWANGQLTTSPVQYFGNSSDYFRDSRTPEISELDYSRMPSTILQAKQAVALAKYAGAERDAATELAEAEALLQDAENAWKAGRKEESVDVTARQSISVAVKAESTATVRKEAREKRNEKTRTDAEFREAETRYLDAQTQIDDLKAELARETRNRELSERDLIELNKRLKEAEERAQRAIGQIDELMAISNAARGDNKVSSTVRVSRYPSIETKAEVAKKEKFAVQISLTEELITPDVKINSVGATAEKESGGKITMALAEEAGREDWDIQVIISASSADFSIEGSNIATLRLPKIGDSTPATFYLSARSFAEAERRSRVMATFIDKKTGTFLARVEREITIKEPVGEGESRDEQNRSASREQNEETGSSQRAKADVASEQVAAPRAAAVRTEPSRRVALPAIGTRASADLTVVIQTNVFNAPENSQIIISSPHLETRAAAFTTSLELEKYLETQFGYFSARSGRGAELASRIGTKDVGTPALMKGFGESLYTNFAPKLFKDAFWALHDKLGGEFKTINIVTDYPNLSWELMRPRRDASTPSLEFLGLSHNIGRLHNQKSRSVGNNQIQTSQISGITVVAPVYNKDEVLPSVAKEIDFLKSLTMFDEAGDGVKRVEGRFEKLQVYLEKAPPHIIHFAGHGTHRISSGNVPNSAIKLTDGEMNSTMLQGILGDVSASRPFFFLNACEVGRSGSIAGFVDGFAPTVLDAGASGYIGALWSIGDSGAQEFAEHFYKAMSTQIAANGSVSVAELLRLTKREYLKNGDPTFLSYTYYGDPNLTLTSRTLKQTK